MVILEVLFGLGFESSLLRFLVILLDNPHWDIYLNHHVQILVQYALNY